MSVFLCRHSWLSPSHVCEHLLKCHLLLWCPCCTVTAFLTVHLQVITFARLSARKSELCVSYTSVCYLVSWDMFPAHTLILGSNEFFPDVCFLRGIRVVTKRWRWDTQVQEVCYLFSLLGWWSKSVCKIFFLDFEVYFILYISSFLSMLYLKLFIWYNYFHKIFLPKKKLVFFD